MPIDGSPINTDRAALIVQVQERQRDDCSWQAADGVNG
jgi:hypothetical protein